MGLLVGLDSLAIGSTWLGIGVLSQLHLHTWLVGTCAAAIGWMDATPCRRRQKHRHSNTGSAECRTLAAEQGKGLIPWLIGVIATLHLHPPYLGTDDHRVVLPEINRFTIEHGWHRLQDLPRRGLPEGMFESLWWIGGGLSIGTFIHQTWYSQALQESSDMDTTWSPMILWIATGIGLCITAAGLGELSRPRYMVGLGMGLLLPIAASLGGYATRWAKIVGCVIGLNLFVNTWAFGQWGQVRARMLGGEPPTVPSAPSIWANKYLRYPILTLRDLTMMGALDFQDTWQTMPNTKGIAVPRLRDDRHRNLQAYAAMKGQSILILDPGKCCAGTPVNAQCAYRIVKAVEQAQLTVVLPTEVEGVERVHANEKRWVADLRSAINSTGTQSEYWHWQQQRRSMRKRPLLVSSKSLKICAE